MVSFPLSSLSIIYSLANCQIEAREEEENGAESEQLLVVDQEVPVEEDPVEEEEHNISSDSPAASQLRKTLSKENNKSTSTIAKTQSRAPVPKDIGEKPEYRRQFCQKCSTDLARFPDLVCWQYPGSLKCGDCFRKGKDCDPVSW